jgi:hypothetical protein
MHALQIAIRRNNVEKDQPMGLQKAINPVPDHYCVFDRGRAM